MYISLSGLVLWMSVTLVLSTSRSNNTLMRNMRLQDRWSRLSTLLDLEIAEGMLISYATAPSAACGGGSADGDLVVTVTIPYLTTLNQVATTAISYFARDRQFFRCGPAVHASGRLLPDQAPVLSRLSERVQFQVDRSSSTSQDPARSLRYSVQFLDSANATLLSRSATARTKVSLVQ